MTPRWIIALWLWAISMALPAQELSFLALGDSYTIGEGIPEEENFPHQLADTLRKYDVHIGEIRVVAKTGWTSGELLHALDSLKLEGTYDIVTLLIGVNNQYRDLPLEEFNVELGRLLKRAKKFAGGESNSVFVLSIPDYGYTPFGEEKQEEITSAINRFNGTVKKVSFFHGREVIDITGLSRRKSKAGMLAEDDLHPSAEQYAAWVSKLAEVIRKERDK